MSLKPLGPRHYLFPMPTVLVGANVNGKPNYLTVAWCGIMQGSPPIIYAALNKIRYTLKGIIENETFSVNIPSTKLVNETDYCGTTSGHKSDKSQVFTSFYGILKTAPMIEECAVTLECRLLQRLDFGGTHEICIGLIVETYANEDVLITGVPDITAVDPIIYSTGNQHYYKIGEKISRAFKPR